MVLSIASACSKPKEAEKIDISSLEVSPYDATKQSADVSMKAKEYFLDTRVEKIPFNIINNSNQEYTFGIEPLIEIEVDGTWYLMPMVEGVAWNDIGYILQANQTLEDVLDVKTYYGKLAEGKYRSVKRFFPEPGVETFAIAEFEVTDEPVAFTGEMEEPESVKGYDEIYDADDRDTVLKILTTYPEDWKWEDAVQDGCYVNIHGIEEGNTRKVWDDFYADVEQGKDAAITIYACTVEGDPMPTYVSHIDGEFYYLTDVSRDKWAGENIEYYDGTCQYLKVFDEQGQITVLLSNTDLEKAEEYLVLSSRNPILFVINKAAVDNQKQPPLLALNFVKNGDNANINALTGTYSWSFEDSDGSTMSTESDSAHPLDIINDLPVIEKANDTVSIGLDFESAPDSVTVKRWNDKYVGDAQTNEQFSEEVEIINTSISLYSIALTDDNNGYIYEVKASWEQGTAYYSFYVS